MIKSPLTIRTVGIFIALALPVAAHAVAQSDPGDDSPVIERVEIRGVSDVRMGELQNSLVTQPTRCRSLFLRPFCWISQSSTFVDRHELDRAEIPRDELRIRVHLWRRGWRNATVSTQITPLGDGVAVRFDVDQGPATIVQDLSIQQTDTVLDARTVRRAGLPEPGERVNVIEIDTARARLLTELGQRGYADAVVRDTILVIDSISALGEVIIDPGRRTTIARIDIEGINEVSEDVIRNALPLEEGGLYRVSDVSEAQRSLYLTGMFSEAIVRVPPQTDSAKVVQVAVNEAPFRQLRTAVGATTADYIQLQGQFTRFNWGGGGRRLDISGTVGRLLAGTLDGVFPFEEGRRDPLPGAAEDAFIRPTWQVSAQVMQPAFPTASTSVGVGVFSHRRVEPGVVVDRGYGGSATLTRRLGPRAPISVQYRYELNTVMAGEVYFCVSYGVCDGTTIDAMQARQSLSPLTIGGFVDQVDDALLRTSGYMVRYGFEHASNVTLSDFGYNRADAEVSRNIQIGSGTLAARVHAGWVKAIGDAGSGLGLHPTKRFYAGGARSTRGFGENQLGPRILTIGPEKLIEADGDDPAPCTMADVVARSCDPGAISSNEFTPRPIGGTRLLEAGIEYRQPIWGALVGAVFIDAARVDDPAIATLGDARSAVTPGFGVRYRSPIGPVRVDLGFRPSSTEDLSVITQIEEDGVARLIRLDHPKRFDPAEGHDGFLSALTRRLTLHLSIGESF